MSMVHEGFTLLTEVYQHYIRRTGLETWDWNAGQH